WLLPLPQLCSWPDRRSLLSDTSITRPPVEVVRQRARILIEADVSNFIDLIHASAAAVLGRNGAAIADEPPISLQRAGGRNLRAAARPSGGPAAHDRKAP